MLSSGQIQHSRASRWRAGSLILVHVLIIAHVIQWLLTGMTLSPVEPSESMQTLREGIVNAGFVMFVVSITSTLLFGRFFCGWACHVVALQDLCGWLLAKLRIKPKPFRSRLLLWFPLCLALYMFVWPVIHREVVRPIFSDERGKLPVWLGQSNPLPGLTTEFIVPDFWATFPTWYVAIPFMLVCGFACVYFLGNKGFCTYGCPYGGFFAPADLFAPGKIRVHDDKCHQCGHCTAVCTSNVRVHEEVRDFGMVTDPGCMKCLDCVSVCPNDALYFGLGKPTILAKPKNDNARATRAKAKALRDARYDLSWRSEVLVAALMVVLVQCYRGMLNQVPLLMAVGMASCVAFLAWTSMRLLTDQNVRLQRLQLKFKGQVCPAGLLVGLGTLAMLALAAWSGVIRWQHSRAELAYSRLSTPIGVVLSPGFAPGISERADAEAAIGLYRFVGPRSEGGWGWELRPDDALNSAYAKLIVGDLEGAERDLEFIMRRGKPADALVFQIAQIKLARRSATPDQLEAFYRDALQKHPELHGVRSALTKAAIDRGDRPGAMKLWEPLLPGKDRSAKAVGPAGLVACARAMAQLEERIRAAQLAGEAANHHDATPDQMLQAAAVLQQVQESTQAAAMVQRAAELSRKTSLGSTQVSAANMLAELSRPDDAITRARAGVLQSRSHGRHIGKADTLFSAGVLLMRLGQQQEGLALVREAADQVRSSAWDSIPIGKFLVSAGVQSKDRALVSEGASIVRRAIALAPDSPMIFLENAQAAYADERFDDALTYMAAAAELAPMNAVLADRYASLLGSRGKTDEAAKWKAEARRRAALSNPNQAPQSPRP